MVSDLEMFGGFYLVLLWLVYRTSLFGCFSRTFDSFHRAPRVTENDWAFVAAALGFKDLAGILAHRRLRNEARPRPFKRLVIFIIGIFIALMVIQIPVALSFRTPIFGSLDVTSVALSASGAMIFLASTITLLGRPSRDWRVRIDEPSGVWDEYVPTKVVRKK